MADEWHREFEQPIETPDGKQLRTLRESVAYLAKMIPKSELDMPAVTTAAEMLTNAAEREMAWMFLARMAVLKAIHRNELPRPINPDRKDPHWASGN